MTHIDHTLEALGLRQLASSTDHGPSAANLIAAAQVHATLALAEQQKVANLIALAKLAGREEDVHEEVAEVAYEALNALVRLKVVPNGHMDPNEVTVLRPDIAAALGIKTDWGES